jgi:hypothetical protein
MYSSLISIVHQKNKVNNMVEDISFAIDHHHYQQDDNLMMYYIDNMMMKAVEQNEMMEF